MCLPLSLSAILLHGCGRYLVDAAGERKGDQDGEECARVGPYHHHHLSRLCTTPPSPSLCASLSAAAYPHVPFLLFCRSMRCVVIQTNATGSQRGTHPRSLLTILKRRVHSREDFLLSLAFTSLLGRVNSFFFFASTRVLALLRFA